MSTAGRAALPIVALPGWGMRGAIFRGVAKAHWQLVDLPGYGEVPLPTDYRVETLADVLAANAPPRCVVLGWSMGSLLAQAWAVRHPASVAALILVSATPCFQQRADWPHGLPAADVHAFAAGVAADWRSTVQRFLSLQARGSDAARSVIARLRAELQATGEPNPATLAAGMQLLADTDLRDRVAAIQVPTLLVHGTRDALCPLGATEWLRDHSQNARLVTIPGAAHAPFLSHPQAFGAALEAFVDAL